MANRTTTKNNIIALNVPTVSNADLNTMLNTYLADNIRFREDVAVIQSSGTTNITVDFTGKDRVDLTRTGGPLNITVSGMEDGDIKYLLITKTAGQAVTFVGVTDMTPVKYWANNYSVILYKIIRKSTYYYAIAIAETVRSATESAEGVLEIGTTAEHNALDSETKIVVPGRIPFAGDSQTGLVQKASSVEVDDGTDNIPAGKGDPLYVAPSELLRKIDELATAGAWVNLTLNTTNFYDSYSGFHLKAFVDNLGFVHIWGHNIQCKPGLTDPAVVYNIVDSLPVAYRAPTGDVVYVSAVAVNYNNSNRSTIYVQVTSSSLQLSGNASFNTYYLLQFYIHFRK